MGTFSLNINKYVESSLKDMRESHKAIILELFTSVILDTPVLEGRLRANWIISSSVPLDGTFDLTDTDGTTTTRKVEDHITRLPDNLDFNVYLTNNLPYAYRIEYDGWSGKALEGMVRKNFARIIQNLQI